jgi:tetratricopeptide (TPR) repeat protein
MYSLKNKFLKWGITQMRLIYQVILFISLISSISMASDYDKLPFQKHELNGVEIEFFRKVIQNNMDLESYYDAFLIASGITDTESFLEYKTKLNILRQKAQEDLSQYVSAGSEVFAEALLKWLYQEQILSKYVIKATLAQDLLDRGQYNCLSSSILYNLLYTEFGFKAKGVLTKDHSFSTIITEDGREIDVETTIAYGYNPGERQVEQLESIQRIVYVPKSNYRDRTDVSVATLIASLYANSISLLGRSINDPLEGLAMYKKGYYLAPDFDFFSKNIVASMNNLAVDYIKNGNYENAWSYFNQLEKFAPNNSITTQNKIYYYNTIGTLYLNAKDYPSAIQAFREGITDIGADGKVLKRNLKVAYYNYAVNEYNAKRYNNANFISNEALEVFPNDRDFLELKKNMPK